MDTFNLAFVLQSKMMPPNSAMAVVTIVCASDENIDRNNVRDVAMRSFKEFIKPHVPAHCVFNKVVHKIKEECGVQAVIVEADCAAVIPL